MRLFKSFEKKLVGAAIIIGAVFLHSLSEREASKDVDISKEQTSDDSDVEILAAYSLGDGNKVQEYSVSSQPDLVTIAVDGMSASGLDTIRDQGFQNSPILLREFDLSVGRIFEFVPAHNENAICKYIDGVRSGALDCFEINDLN